jgi:hypothetical protein
MGVGSAPAAKINQVRVYDSATLGPVTPPMSNLAWMLALAFSANGQDLQTLTRDEFAVWHVPTACLVSGGKAHANYRVALASGGNRFAIGENDERIIVEDTCGSTATSPGNLAYITGM